MLQVIWFVFADEEAVQMVMKSILTMSTGSQQEIREDKLKPLKERVEKIVRNMKKINVRSILKRETGIEQSPKQLTPEWTVDASTVQRLITATACNSPEEECCLREEAQVTVKLSTDGPWNKRLTCLTIP